MKNKHQISTYGNNAGMKLEVSKGMKGAVQLVKRIG